MPTRRIRRIFHRGPWACLFAAVLLSAVTAIEARPAAAQELSLADLRDLCFFMPWEHYRREPGKVLRVEPTVRGPSVRLRVRNQSWHDDATICVYDTICHVIRFRGRLLPGSHARFETCADRQRRGSIIILEAFGEALRYDNLRSGTLNLPGYRSRR